MNHKSVMYYIRPLITLVSAAALAHCTTAITQFPAFNSFDVLQIANPETSHETSVSLFTNQCKLDTVSGKQFEEYAIEAEWKPADPTILKKAGLLALSNKVLEIPGGGSNIRETQSLFYKQHQKQLFILAIEERFQSDKLLFTSCRLHADEVSVLETCALLGKTIGRAPDINRHYKSNDARFISWNGTIDQKQTSILCQKSAATVQMPYTGLVLSVTIGNRNQQARLQQEKPEARHSQ